MRKGKEKVSGVRRRLLNQESPTYGSDGSLSGEESTEVQSFGDLSFSKRWGLAAKLRRKARLLRAKQLKDKGAAVSAPSGLIPTEFGTTYQELDARPSEGYHSIYHPDAARGKDQRLIQRRESRYVTAGKWVSAGTAGPIIISEVLNIILNLAGQYLRWSSENAGNNDSILDVRLKTIVLNEEINRFILMGTALFFIALILIDKIHRTVTNLDKLREYFTEENAENYTQFSDPYNFINPSDEFVDEWLQKHSSYIGSLLNKPYSVDGVAKMILSAMDTDNSLWTVEEIAHEDEDLESSGVSTSSVSEEEHFDVRPFYSEQEGDEDPTSSMYLSRRRRMAATVLQSEEGADDGDDEGATLSAALDDVQPGATAYLRLYDNSVNLTEGAGMLTRHRQTVYDQSRSTTRATSSAIGAQTGERISSSHSPAILTEHNLAALSGDITECYAFPDSAWNHQFTQCASQNAYLLLLDGIAETINTSEPLKYKSKDKFLASILTELMKDDYFQSTPKDYDVCCKSTDILNQWYADSTRKMFQLVVLLTRPFSKDCMSTNLLLCGCCDPEREEVGSSRHRHFPRELAQKAFWHLAEKHQILLIYHLLNTAGNYNHGPLLAYSLLGLVPLIGESSEIRRDLSKRAAKLIMSYAKHFSDSPILAHHMYVLILPTKQLQLHKIFKQYPEMTYYILAALLQSQNQQHCAEHYIAALTLFWSAGFTAQDRVNIARYFLRHNPELFAKLFNISCDMSEGLSGHINLCLFNDPLNWQVLALVFRNQPSLRNEVIARFIARLAQWKSIPTSLTYEEGLSHHWYQFSTVLESAFSELRASQENIVDAITRAIMYLIFADFDLIAKDQCPPPAWKLYSRPQHARPADLRELCIELYNFRSQYKFKLNDIIGADIEDDVTVFAELGDEGAADDARAIEEKISNLKSDITIFTIYGCIEYGFQQLLGVRDILDILRPYLDELTARPGVDKFKYIIKPRLKHYGLELRGVTIVHEYGKHNPVYYHMESGHEDGKHIPVYYHMEPGLVTSTEDTVVDADTGVGAGAGTGTDSDSDIDSDYSCV